MTTKSGVCKIIFILHFSITFDKYKRKMLERRKKVNKFFFTRSCWSRGGIFLGEGGFAPLFRDSTQPDINSVILSEIHFHQTLALIYIEEEHAKVKFFPKEP